MSSGTLSCLPTELIQGILAEVKHTDLRAFHAFRSCSRSCKALADLVFYQKIVLADFKEHHCRGREYHELNVKERPANPWEGWSCRVQENVDFLLDSTHPASYIVRDLTIGPFEHPERTIDESSLVKILSTLDILLDFRWRTSCRLSPELLQTLIQKFPDCRFHVGQLHRQDGNMDVGMMSHPALRSIELAVLSDYSSQISEFVLLNKILPQLKHLESLFLYRADMESIHPGAHDVEECHLEELFPQLQGPDWLSTPLEHARIKTLTLGSREIKDEWPAQIRPWLMGMNWASLTFLDIRNSVHGVVLRALRDRTPCLRILKLGDAHDVYGVADPSPTNDYLRDFLSTTSMLNDISIGSDQCPAWEYYLETVLSSTGRRLHQFAAEPGYRYTFGSLPRWTTQEVAQLQIRAPNLRHLALDVRGSGRCRNSETSSSSLFDDCDDFFGRLPLQDPHQQDAVPVPGSAGPDALPEIFSQFIYLERLYLHLEAHNGRACLEYCGGGKRDEMDVQKAKFMVGNIFDASILRRPHCPLEYVEIVIDFTCRFKSRWRIKGRRKFEWPFGAHVPFSLEMEFRVYRKSWGFWYDEVTNETILCE